MTQQARDELAAGVLGPETLARMKAAYEAACGGILGAVSDADRLRLARAIVTDVRSGISEEGELRLRAIELLRRPE